MSSATATQPVLHDMDVVDMDITQLRDEALNSHQIGRASERQCPADIIPVVQQRLLNQIQNGKFVEFQLLLPSHAPALTNNYLVDIVDNNAGETHSRVKIANFQSWLKAWNIYLRCMIDFHSHLTTQLLYYQTQITQFASIYTFQSWSLYDHSLRLRLASKAIARWDFDDVELRSQHLATTPPPNNPTCWSCKQSGHYSVNCPPKSGRATFSSVGGVSPFLADPASSYRATWKITSLCRLASQECKHPRQHMPQGSHLFILELREGAPAINATASTTAAITVPSNTAI